MTLRLEARLKVLNRDRLWLEASTKSKLRTFIQIFDRTKRQDLVKANITRNQQSLIARLKAGVLSLALETGRLKNLDIEDRVCLCCNSGVTEDECHLLTTCEALDAERKAWYRELGIASDTKEEKIETVKRLVDGEN